MKRLYLALTVLGAVGPYVFLVPHFEMSGLSLPALLGAGFANPGASAFATDLLLSSLVFWVSVLASRDRKRAWLLIPVTLLIGLSCALPLYLYVRSREAQEPGGRQDGPVGLGTTTPAAGAGS